LAVILIAAILGFGFATGFFTKIPSPDAPRAQTVVPAPVTPSVQVATMPTAASGAQVTFTPINLDAVLGPRPKTVFTRDEKHVLARETFAIYKNPSEDRQDEVGYIQNGMLLEVLEKRENCFKVPVKPKSENPQEASDEYEDPHAGMTLDCYKVKKPGKEGWVVDRGVLDFEIAVPTNDPRDLTWLFQRYGENTWFSQEDMNENSFTNEEYERLILSAQGGNEAAQAALRLTLMKSLEKNPDDPKLAGFKDKVEFLQQAPNY
jgi:hypothetical protein